MSTKHTKKSEKDGLEDEMFKTLAKAITPMDAVYIVEDLGVKLRKGLFTWTEDGKMDLSCFIKQFVMGPLANTKNGTMLLFRLMAFKSHADDYSDSFVLAAKKYYPNQG